MVAFVHDELLIELPLLAGDRPFAQLQTHANIIERVMIDAMESVW